MRTKTYYLYPGSQVELVTGMNVQSNFRTTWRFQHPNYPHSDLFGLEIEEIIAAMRKDKRLPLPDNFGVIEPIKETALKFRRASVHLHVKFMSPRTSQWFQPNIVFEFNPRNLASFNGAVRNAINTLDMYHAYLKAAGT